MLPTSQIYIAMQVIRSFFPRAQKWMLLLYCCWVASISQVGDIMYWYTLMSNNRSIAFNQIKCLVNMMSVQGCAFTS